MYVSNLVLYGAIEAFVFVCIVAIILLFYIGKLKAKQKKVNAFAKKIMAQVKQLKASVETAKNQFSVSNAYKKQINDQLLLTRKYHGTLEAGQDIALDLNPESPLPRQAAALRHAILIAEKEALHQSQDGTPNWQIIESKLGQILQFYSDFDAKKGSQEQQPDVEAEGEETGGESPQMPASHNQSQEVEELKRTLDGMLKALGERHEEVDKLETDLETAHKRIGNLEQFKKLFFEMEDQWKDAKQEAQIYYDKLMAMRDEVQDRESFEDALEKYNNVYVEVEKTIQSITDEDDQNEFTLSDLPPAGNAELESKPTGSSTEIHNSEKRALEELKKLRNLTADQHRLINQLQKKLEESDSVEEKVAIIKQLEEELTRQMGFVEESELCIKLLEDELSNAMTRARQLEETQEKMRDQMSHMPKMQETLHSFAVESKVMLKFIAEMEQKVASQSSSEGENADQKSEQVVQLEQLRDQLQNLQSQYADLEERYLEARSGT